MRKEHIKLDHVNALAKDESSLNHTQLLEQQASMFHEMEERFKMNLINSMADFAQSHDEEEEKKEDPASSELTATLTTTTSKKRKNEDKLIPMIEMLTKKVDRLEAKDSQNDVINKENINTRTGKPFRRYFWTHGCCDHWSRTCPDRKKGHQVNATFKNRMGGSTEGVLEPDKGGEQTLDLELYKFVIT